MATRTEPRGRAYYNEHDKFAAAWLRNLIRAGLIAEGDVDERDIQDVRAGDLDGYAQVHLFAGIGGWSRALRLAGWPDDEPVWTGSCPCQPFSSAGRAKGVLDSRHLWPAFQRLVALCRPATIFGEQVASRDGREWLAGVRTDLEILGYAVGAADLCAACVGSPQIRQRIYWVADAQGCASGRERCGLPATKAPRAAEQHDGDNRSWNTGEYGAVGVVHAAGAGQQEQWSQYRPRGERHRGLAGLAVQVGVPKWNGPTIAIKCSDGARRVSAQSDTFPLAHGVSGRVGRFRAYGNAIVPQVAAQFVMAFREIGG